MADESGWKEGSEITLEESGPSIADAAFGTLDDNNFTVANNEISTGVAGTHLKCRLTTLDTATNFTVGGVANLYARPQNIESTEDGEPPTANYPHTFVCAFPLDDDEAITQDVEKDLVRNPFPHTEWQGYLENAAGQTISAGFNVRVTPKYFAPGA